MDIWLCEEGLKNFTLLKVFWFNSHSQLVYIWGFKRWILHGTSRGNLGNEAGRSSGIFLDFILSFAGCLWFKQAKWPSEAAPISCNGTQIDCLGLEICGDGKEASQPGFPGKKREEGEICSQQKLSESLFQDLTLSALLKSPWAGRVKEKKCPEGSEINSWALRWIHGLRNAFWDEFMGPEMNWWAVKWIPRSWNEFMGPE